MLIFTDFFVVVVCGALAATDEYMMAPLQLTELHVFFMGVFLVANGGKSLMAAVIIFVNRIKTRVEVSVQI